MVQLDSNPLAFRGLRCPTCGYDASGLREPVCPECGTKFDPEALRQRTHRPRRRWLTAAGIMLLAYYAPYSWLLFIDYPWSDYHWSWIAMWPALPMMIVGMLLRATTGLEPDDGVGLLLLYGTAAVIYLGLVWLAARGTMWLIFTALIVLALSSLNSFGLYHAFRA